MDGEIQSFIKVWVTAITSLCYCYYVVSHIPRGIIRLISLLPIIYLFIILPLNLSSVHLGAPTVFYLVWLANFKLLLFSFDQGPLLSHPPLSVLHFISIALLPIKTKQTPSPQSPPNPSNNTHPSLNLDKSLNPPYKITQTRHRPVLLAIKALLLALIIRLYQCRQYLHPNIILALYCCHIYLGVELVLAITAFMVRAILALELEPQFNEPYLATSLQDFWGRRWNLMVTSILRPTVYNPIRSICTPMLGRTWARVPAIFATFLVSGLVHEIIFFYMTRVSPTWEVTWFFVLHGVCTAMEVAAQKALTSRYRLHRAVSVPLTVGFVAVTGVWLFLPQILRNGVELKAIKEYSILLSFVRDQLPTYLHWTKYSV